MGIPFHQGFAYGWEGLWVFGHIWRQKRGVSKPTGICEVILLGEEAVQVYAIRYQYASTRRVHNPTGHVLCGRTWNLAHDWTAGDDFINEERRVVKAMCRKYGDTPFTEHAKSALQVRRYPLCKDPNNRKQLLAHVTVAHTIRDLEFYASPSPDEEYVTIKHPTIFEPPRFYSLGHLGIFDLSAPRP